MRNRSTLCLTAVTAVALTLTPRADAQEEDAGARDGEFSVQRFEPAAGPNNYMQVERLRMKKELGWSAGLWFNYARDPFVVVSCVSETDCSSPNASNTEDVAIVSNMMTWDVVGSFNPTDFIQIGLRVPLSFVSGQDLDTTTGAPAGDLTGFGLGDPNLEGKFRFYGDPDGLVPLGGRVGPGLRTRPATAENKYIGNSSPVTVGWRGIADFKIDDFTVGANLRGVFRGESSLGSTTVGPVEFRYGVGAGYQISPVFAVPAEGVGGTQFPTENGPKSPADARRGHAPPRETGPAVVTGGGAGVFEGVGVPVPRGIFGIQWNAEGSDQDADGVGDTDDQCPTKPEDEDGFEDEDGCPDLDNDKDGVADGADKCPDKMEVINGVADDDGCPDDVKDSDEDGVADGDDKCPQQKGEVRSKEFYGCSDTDKDGVADPVDKCIDGAEDTDGFEDTDGCPDPDNDKDGVPDASDECGDQPETKHGIPDEDGCPDRDPAAAPNPGAAPAKPGAAPPGPGAPPPTP